MTSPFPYFGGKSRIASDVWQRFGDPDNYVEPFFGSGAVLLSRPTPAKTETVNDADCYLANFWRALQHDPEAVARHADWPVSENDLLARHHWLMTQEDFRARMRTDPEHYDAKVAGWWVWGMCAWIGEGWCAKEANKLPHVGDAGMGINRKLPHLGDAGMGINRKLPHIGNAGRGADASTAAATPAWASHAPLRPTTKGKQIEAYFIELAERLRGVRVACGDWKRVCGPSVTHRHGTTAVFLDPPYGAGAMNYSAGGNADGSIAADVAAWAVAEGANPLMRIALCGYNGTITMPPDWSCIAWKTPGGYGSQGDGVGRENAERERIWFSPHCIAPRYQQEVLTFTEPTP